jgi:hypothetical protein
VALHCFGGLGYFAGRWRSQKMRVFQFIFALRSLIFLWVEFERGVLRCWRVVGEMLLLQIENRSVWREVRVLLNFRIHLSFKIVIIVNNYMLVEYMIEYTLRTSEVHVVECSVLIEWDWLLRFVEWVVELMLHESCLFKCNSLRI